MSFGSVATSATAPQRSTHSWGCPALPPAHHPLHPVHPSALGPSEKGCIAEMQLGTHDHNLCVHLEWSCQSTSGPTALFPVLSRCSALPHSCSHYSSSAPGFMQPCCSTSRSPEHRKLFLQEEEKCLGQHSLPKDTARELHSDGARRGQSPPKRSLPSDEGLCTTQDTPWLSTS